MERIAIISTVVIVLMQSSPLHAQTGKILQETTQDWGTIMDRTSGCMLVNNTWNKRSAPDGFSQSVFLEEGRAIGGWRWNAPGTGASVVSMPEIVCGDKPWDEPRKLRTDFPFRAGEKRLIADFDADLQASGRYNMAFMMWAVSSLPASRQNITHEIMIWNVDSPGQRAGRQIGSLTASGTTFDVFLHPAHKDNSGSVSFTWTYVAFIARQPLLKGTIDFGDMIDFLLERKILSRDNYITSLELGDEVSSGTGLSEIRKLEVSVR